MGVHRMVVEWLEAQNHEEAHLSDLGLHTLPDLLIFEKAVAEHRYQTHPYESKRVRLTGRRR